MQPNDYLPTISAVAREAGAIVRAGYAQPRDIAFKGAVDLITQYDTASEEIILRRLRAAYPEHDVFAEESGVSGTQARYVWVVDPIDGTTNFAHGFPAFAVSIALAERAGDVLVPLAGVVYDPLRDEFFAAARGAGATLNGAPLRVSTTALLDRSLLATGFPYDIRTAGAPWNNLDLFAKMHLVAQGLRRAGAAALDLAYVAAGRLDGYWELSTKPYDIAAGALLVEEAGGRLTDLYGRATDYSGRTLLATNGLIHEEALAVLRLAG